VRPAGYAFAVWGVICLGVLAHGAAGLAWFARDPDWDRGRWALFASLAIGPAWIPVAQVSPIWATVLIWAMLLSALAALARAPQSPPWLARAPLGLYAGWLTAASFVSVGLIGAGYGIGPGSQGWAWIALALALVCAALMQLRLAATPFYGLAVAWGVAAIAVRNWGETPALAYVAAGGAALMLGLAATRISALSRRG